MKRNLILIAPIFMLAFGAAPDASAQWVQTNGPYGGNITALAKEGNYLYAGCENGIFRSSNNGKSWVSIRNGMPRNNSTFNIYISGSNVIASTYWGLYLSTNNGNSWTQPNSELTGSGNSSIALVTIGGNTLASSFLSSDNGLSWTPVLDTLLNRPTAYAVMAANLFAVTGYGVILSTDSGRSWTRVDSEVTGGIYALAASGTKLFAGSAKSTYSGGVILSTDSGRSWKSVGLTNIPIYALAVYGSELFAATSDSGIYVSIDEGNNWDSVGFSNNEVHTFFVDSTNIFLGSVDGVFISTDNGRSWVEVDSGLMGFGYNALAVIGNNLFASTENEYGVNVFQSTNNGSIWNSPNTGIANSILLSFGVIGTNLFAGTYGNGVFISTDNARSWTQVDSGLMGYGDDRFVWSFGEGGTDIFAGTSNGVFLSTNDGINWVEENNGLPITGQITAQSFAEIGTNLFAAVNASNGGNVYRSTNNGISWTDVSTGLPSTQFGNTPVLSLAVIDTNLFAGVWGDGGVSGVFLSTDSGTSWNAVKNGLSDTNGISLLAVGSNLFAGTYGGVFLSTNNGTSWLNVSNGLGDKYVNALAVCGAELIAGTDSAGIWKKPLSDFGISAVTQTPPSQPQIQSYPNPFSRSTTVTFLSQDVGFAKVTVVNLLGAQVAQLFSGELSAGEHSFVWDANGMPPGMYECIVQSNEQVQRVGIILSEP